MTESTYPSATVMELVRSWPRWVGTAEAVGEDALATRLVVASPADALDPDVGDLVLARTSVLRGRPQDAVDLLRGTELGPPHEARPADVVAAAARAATVPGDDEYRWLRAHAAYARGTDWSPTALRLLASVADARGDTATADRAWEALIASAGWRTPEALARLATTTISRRDRHDRFSVQAHALDAANVALAGSRRTHPDVGAVIDAASRLVERGDPAGALLLLRTVRSLVRRPGRAGTARATVRATESAMLGTPLSRCRVRLGSFTTVERRAWRTLAHVRLDGGPSGPVVGRQRDTLGAVVAVVAVLAAIGPAVMTLGWMSSRLAGWDWLQFAVFVFIMLAPAFPPLALLAGIRAVLGRRAHRRRAATDDSHERAAAEQCVCWDTGAVIGRGSVYYLERHLVTAPAEPAADRTLTALGDGTTTARCPVSSVLWLVVPTAAENFLLMRGALFTPEPDTSVQDAFLF